MVSQGCRFQKVMGGKIEKNTQEKNEGKNKSKMSILRERGSIIIREKPEWNAAVSMSKQCMRPQDISAGI